LCSQRSPSVVSYESVLRFSCLPSLLFFSLRFYSLNPYRMCCHTPVRPLFSLPGSSSLPPTPLSITVCRIMMEYFVCVFCLAGPLCPPTVLLFLNSDGPLRDPPLFLGTIPLTPSPLFFEVPTALPHPSYFGIPYEYFYVFWPPALGRIFCRRFFPISVTLLQ